MDASPGPWQVLISLAGVLRVAEWFTVDGVRELLRMAQGRAHGLQRDPGRKDEAVGLKSSSQS